MTPDTKAFIFSEDYLRRQPAGTSLRHADVKAAMMAVEKAAWQPIATAPKDGTWVLCRVPNRGRLNPDRPIPLYFHDAENSAETGWYDDEYGTNPPVEPDLWQPMPALPA